jgi:hypothetical protein
VHTSRISTLGIATVYGLDGQCSIPPKGKEIFLYSTVSGPALWPIQPPIKRVPGALFAGAKQPGREADRSPTSSAEVKNGGAIPPILQYLNGTVFNGLSTGRILPLPCISHTTGRQLDWDTWAFQHVSMHVTCRKPLRLGERFQVPRDKTVLPLIPSVTQHTHVTQLHDS